MQEDIDPDSLQALCGTPAGYPAEWKVADFDLDFCADKPDCFYIDGHPPGCPNSCMCLCTSGTVTYEVCTMLGCPDEGECFRCAGSSD